jgi:hypothetical protein
VLGHDQPALAGGLIWRSSEKIYVHGATSRPAHTGSTAKGRNVFRLAFTAWFLQVSDLLFDGMV